MKHLLYALTLLALISTAGLRAQDKDNNADAKGFRKEWLAQFEEISQKLVDLAGAMPAESYGWRPMDGVRSVSEVYMHIALGNFSYAGFAGTKRPDGISRDMEKTVTEKAKVVDILSRSLAHLKSALAAVPDSKMDDSTKVWGSMTTIRDAFFGAATHMHEHLGQSIAYARMNKVVPPWTAAEEAAAKKEKK